MKKKFCFMLLFLLAGSANSAENHICQGKNCSEFEKYLKQSEQTFIKMVNLNEACLKKDGKSCYEIAGLLSDYEQTTKADFQPELKLKLEKVGFKGDSKAYYKMACDLKNKEACGK